jgi:hypothetical protein
LSRRARPGPASPGCLDAETLAAYADGGLDAQALAGAEAHLAACAHCQTVIAAIVSRGDEVAGSPAVAPGRAWWGQLRWLMPLAGAAAAVVLWMVVPDSVPARYEDTMPPAIAEGPPQPSPAPEATPPAPPFDSRRPGGDASAPQAAARDVAPEAANELTGRQADREQRRERAGADLAPRTAEQPGLVDADRMAKAEAIEEPKAVDAARAAPRPAAPAAEGALASIALPIDLRSIDPGVRWRLVDRGFVERSTNGGASWDRFDTGVRTPLRAGACLSTSVCWVVGDEGVVLRTTDGRTWRRVSSPTPEHVVGVEAMSEAAAVVRAAGGQRFSTGDAGATWTRLP